jgi:hypothetical protein
MIKNNVMRVIMLIIAVNLISCDSIKKATEPEDIGMYAFELLKTLSQTSKSDYVNNFLTIEELRELAKNEEVVTDPYILNEFTSMLKQEWVEDIEDDYGDLKQDGGEYGIKWAEIEYLDFVYEMNNEGGIKFCEGELFFEFKEDLYSVELAAIFDGTEYKLVELDYLYMD